MISSQYSSQNQPSVIKNGHTQSRPHLPDISFQNLNITRIEKSDVSYNTNYLE